LENGASKENQIIHVIVEMYINIYLGYTVTKRTVIYDISQRKPGIQAINERPK